MNTLSLKISEDDFVKFIKLFNDEGCDFLPYNKLVLKYQHLMEAAEHPFAYVWRFNNDLIQKLTLEEKQTIVNELIGEYLNSK